MVHSFQEEKRHAASSVSPKRLAWTLVITGEINSFPSVTHFHEFSLSLGRLVSARLPLDGYFRDVAPFL